MTSSAIISNAKYPLRQLGKNGPFVSAIGLGTMGVRTPWYGKMNSDADTFTALSYAADREAALGRWFTHTGRRADIFLASKFGYTNLATPMATPTPTPDSTPSYIRTALARSLDQLQTTYIDLYYQHRVDPSVPIEVVLETLRPHLEAGTISWLGLSECSSETLRRAKAVKGVGEKVIAVQMEYSAFTLDIEKSGFAKVAEELGVSVVAYSPLARGMITGTQRSRDDFAPTDARLRLPRYSAENFSKNLVLADAIAAIASTHSLTAAQVALAWILAEHPGWVPIPGSSSVARIEENAKAAQVVLPEDAIREITRLADNAEVAGERNFAIVDGDCIAYDAWKGKGNI
ncbi:hypothetical protein HWV62_14028 [Athelia sp. TMB]|nr:hypothetical protein HWV62_14028 [Athelia sp. TMB]